jgi:hypothetical protein
MIAIIFILSMISAILLSLMGGLPFWASGLTAAICLSGLGVLGAIDQQQRRNIKRLCRLLRAKWGLSVLHLGGLPLPLDTPGILFLLSGCLQMDAEQDHLRIPLDELRKILLVNAEQIRKHSDRQLCDLLATGNIRSFSSLREKIRHHDIAVRRHGIMMITWKPEREEIRLLVLSTRHSLASLAACFGSLDLPDGQVDVFDFNGQGVTRVI